MVIHRPLDEVLRSWSQVAVLRALIDTVTGYTGNEMGRMTGMQPRSALKALTILEELGIVRRQRGGRDHIFTLNREHFLVREALLPLYATERRFSEALKDELSASLTKWIVAAVVFGSSAKGEETAQSDYDLCCVVAKEGDKEVVGDVVRGQAAELLRVYGVKIAPLIFTVEEFKKRARTQLGKEILRNGKLVAGQEIKKVIESHGKANRPKSR